MKYGFLSFLALSVLVLASCGRECPIGVNYSDPSCPGYVGTYTNPYGNPYGNPYQQPYQYPYPTGNYPYYPGQYQYPYPSYPYQQPGYVPNNYNYPCDPANPYCYR